MEYVPTLLDVVAVVEAVGGVMALILSPFTKPV